MPKRLFICAGFKKILSACFAAAILVPQGMIKSVTQNIRGVLNVKRRFMQPSARGLAAQTGASKRVIAVAAIKSKRRWPFRIFGKNPASAANEAAERCFFRAVRSNAVIAQNKNISLQNYGKEITLERLAADISESCRKKACTISISSPRICICPRCCGRWSWPNLGSKSPWCIIAAATSA